MRAHLEPSNGQPGPTLRRLSTEVPRDRHRDQRRPDRDRYHPDARHRWRPAGEQRPSGRADGRRADGLRALDALPAPRAHAPRLVRSRPVRAVGRSREHAPVLAAPPDRLRPAARRAQALPAARLAHARPPRVRPDRGRRGHDRAARAGLRERGRHGHRRAAPGGRVRPRPATTSSTTGRTASAPTATSRRASRPRRPASPGTSGWASSCSCTTTTTSSSTGRPRWPGRRTSSPASTPIGWHTQRVEDGNDLDAIDGRHRRRPRRRPAEPHRGAHAHRLRLARTGRTARRRTARRSAPTRSA